MTEKQTKDIFKALADLWNRALIKKELKAYFACNLKEPSPLAKAILKKAKEENPEE